MGAAAISGGALFVIYLLTLAPSVTLWDSGEFLAAIHSLGIPHPPGTPLFVFIADVWARLFGWLPFAFAVNLASATATAGALAIFAWLLERWTGRRAAGAAGAVVAGTMAAVWQSATETEVYAYSLLAIALAMAVAEVSGTRASPRHRTLVAFLFGLAVPLHISVLVAGPAIILLSATDRGGSRSVRAALAPAGAWCLAAGFGTVTILPIVCGGVLVVASWLLPSGGPLSDARRASVLSPLVTVLGASFVFVMLVRARHEPAVNEGNPVSWQSMVDVVARRQYDVPPIWPRRAPTWLQLGNVVQYADWQVAAAMSDAPGPSPWRTPVTIAFVALGIAGSAWHRRRDRRGWDVLGVLFTCATVGVVAILNLRAGPSYGWGVLPDDALHEARERDYFFALAFAVWGLWCGCGIVAFADRFRSQAARASWLLVALPALLNWNAVDRRQSDDSRLPAEVADALLTSLPSNAVLVVAGDNDTFPLWYAQEVGALRRDVTTVTIPLLGAEWYRDELRRRHSLLTPDLAAKWGGLSATLRGIGDATGLRGRPLAVAVSVEPGERYMLRPNAAWRLDGMWYRPMDPTSPDQVLLIDSADVERAALERRAWRNRGAPSLPARDPAGRYVERLLSCPEAAVRRVVGSDRGRTTLLESICNFR